MSLDDQLRDLMRSGGPTPLALTGDVAAVRTTVRRRVRRRRVAVGGAAAAVALAGAAALVTGTHHDRVDIDNPAGQDTRPPTTPTSAPPAVIPLSISDVRLAPLTGGPTTTLGAQLGGTPVVVNFFSSWCLPCVRQMPALQRVDQDLGGKVAILGVAFSDSTRNALATVAQTRVTYPTYADVDGVAFSYFGTMEVPTTVFFDRAGKVLDVHTGAMSEQELRAELADLYGMALSPSPAR